MSRRRQESWRDVGVRPPAGVVERRILVGREPRSRAAIVFSSPLVYDLPQTTALRAVAEVLQTRLREALSEALAGTSYDPGAPCPTTGPLIRDSRNTRTSSRPVS